MILAIRNIGKYLLESGEATKVDIIKNLVNKINGDTIKEILLINVMDNGIETEVEQFYTDIVINALYFQAGRGVKGGGVRGDFYSDDKKEKSKFTDKIKKAATYCEVDAWYEEIEKIILDRIENVGNDFFAVILKNGKYPMELYSEKFMEDFYKTDFKQLKGKHTCHLCENYGEGFNTVTYKFFTNDKEVYGNINEKNKSGMVICKNCLNEIILGKKHIEQYHTTYWIGNNVMFVPHSYNEDIDYIYRDTALNGEENIKFLDNLKTSEGEVLEELGKGNSETDIIFFKKDGEKTFNIFHTIKSLLPSRFAFLAERIRERKVSLFWLINKTSCVKVGSGGLEATDKERFRIIEQIFQGKKINRNLFFQRMMKIYKEGYYLKDNKKTSIKEINKYYNFLVDCSCLQGGFDYMKDYKDYSQLFDENRNYFKTNEKKAWFIVGVAYNKLNYAIKSANKDENGNKADRSSLDKNFFFARKFDFRDFITFTNLIDEKMRKYQKINTNYLKGMLVEAKELMASKENKISTDEAKYLFFWGMDMYFKIEGKEKLDEEVIEGVN